MENIINDGRENWTKEEWQEYNQMLAEAEQEVEDEMYEDAIEADIGI